MPSKQFYFLGEDIASAAEVEVDASGTFEDVRLAVAGNMAIVEPSGNISPSPPLTCKMTWVLLLC